MAQFYGLTWTLLLLIVLYLSKCHSQNGNSRPNIESLIHMESEMIDFFNYALREEMRLHDGRDVHGFAKLYKFLEDVEPMNRDALVDVTKIADDLLQILVLKRRLSRDWAPLLELIHKSEFVKKVPITLRRIESMQYVIQAECDLRKTILEDILRIQHYYKASPGELLVSPRDVTKLESEDVARIMTAAKDIADYSTALNWIKFGHSVCNGSSDSNMKKYFLNLKAGVYIKMYKLAKAEKIFAYLAKTDPSSRSAASNLRFIRHKIEEGGPSPVAATQKGNFSDDYVMQLCRGNVQPSKVGARPLKCYTKMIEDLEKPVFIEEVHHQPRVVLLRNVYSEAEFEYIQRHALHEMMAKLILDKKYTISSSRLRKGSDTIYLQKFFSGMRNLTFQGSNVRRDDIIADTKIECEGPGGKDNIFNHQPWLMKNLELTLPIVNSITFMDDVISGGGVAFPDMHLKIEPEKGSILLWQFKSPHGAVHPKFRRYINCPVVKGNQWVIRSTIEHRGIVRQIDL